MVTVLGATTLPAKLTSTPLIDDKARKDFTRPVYTESVSSVMGTVTPEILDGGAIYDRPALPGRRISGPAISP